MEPEGGDREPGVPDPNLLMLLCQGSDRPEAAAQGVWVMEVCCRARGTSQRLVRIRRPGEGINWVCLLDSAE